MLKNKSVATIGAPEFIQIEPCNDLISKCEIKVLYVGENRNMSSISKEVAIKMAKTLPGVPIVAAYRSEIDDFGDHGHIITIEDGEIKFSCKTVPYGFVSPDAKIWFQKFIDTDEAGNQVEREYLMTTGYLWTGQFPEVQKVIDEGMPQSMELDDATLNGQWATNKNSGVEFFIINDATFSKLCILGSDVEPCFEGASITAPEISRNFTKNPEFVDKLLSMRKEYYALQNEGESDMLDDKPEEVVEENVEFSENVPADAPMPTEEAPAAEFEEVAEVAEVAENADATETEVVSEEFAAEEVAEEASEEFACGGDKKKYAEKEEEEDEDKNAEEDDEESVDESTADEDEKKKPATDHSLEDVESEFAAMKAAYESVQAQLASANAELKSLRAFKLGIENQQKDALITKYFMLDDADKAEVIEHKSEYSYDEIEQKLALAYVKKNVDFSTVDGEPEVEEQAAPAVTFSLETPTNTSFFSDTIGEALLAKRNER